MKRKEIACIAIMAALSLLLFSSGCIVAERPDHRGVETYYYYPDNEVYYYPREGRYYWLERGEWRHEPQPPPRFVLRERDRVRIDLDHEPHTDHDRIKKSYPPGHHERDDRRDEGREERREDR